jgi:hypothetical protein
MKLFRREILCMRRCRLYSVDLTRCLMEGFCENGNELCTMNLAFNLLFLCPFHSTPLTDESGGDFQQVGVCRRGNGLRMPTSYFYTPDGSTIVLKVHAVTSCIQVLCHLSLRHVTSLAAEDRLWFVQALASVLVPSEQNNVVTFRSFYHVIATFFFFTL